MRCLFLALASGVCADRLQLESDVVFTAPSWTRSERAVASEVISPIFMLRHDPAQLKAFEKTLMDISTPGRPQYGKHLSRAEVAEQLPPVPGSHEAVLGLLKEHGIADKDIEVSSDMISAKMTVGKAEEIFETKLHHFQHKYGTDLVRAASPYSLPEEVAQHLYVVGNLVQLPALEGVKKVDMSNSSDFLGSFPNGCGGGCRNSVTPAVLQQAYSFDAPPSNQKTSMAVAEFQGVSWDAKDLKHFGQQCNLDGITVDKQIGTNPGVICDIPLIGGELCMEALLDIEYIKAVAGDIPLSCVSNMQYSLLDFAKQLDTMDDPPLVMSVSYGDDEKQQQSAAYMDSANAQFMKLGARGISVLFASGDQGVVGRTGKTRDGKYHPDFPAASPYITAVGGTDFAQKSVIGAEKAWSDGGGGFSDHFEIPDYQKDAVAAYLSSAEAAGVLPDDAHFTRTGRGYPDVAALGGQQNPYCVAASLLGVISNMVGVAGTSAACPVVAGIFARLNALRAENGMPPMGFLNPFIYQNPTSFNDVSLGAITGAAGVQGFSAIEGWDAATGMGTPNFEKLQEAALSASVTV